MNDTNSEKRELPRLEKIRNRLLSATPGPWWSDESDQTWRLHGVAGYVPGLTGETVMVNRQIAKAAKMGTPYAEYWPEPADDTFITHAWEDITALLEVVDTVRKLADGWYRAPDVIDTAGSQAERRCAMSIMVLLRHSFGDEVERARGGGEH